MSVVGQGRLAAWANPSLPAVQDGGQGLGARSKIGPRPYILSAGRWTTRGPSAADVGHQAANARRGWQKSKYIFYNLFILKLADAIARSIWKGPYIDCPVLRTNKKLDARVFGRRPKTHEPVFYKYRTLSRRSTILPNFIGHTFNIYNGKSFKSIRIIQDMVGHKFGEFSPTRKIGAKPKSRC
mgnify:CR=1 FL=1